jgi:hypothetical protein
MCIALPQLLACLDVEKRQDKENKREQKHGCVLHGVSELLIVLRAGDLSGMPHIDNLGLRQLSVSKGFPK